MPQANRPSGSLALGWRLAPIRISGREVSGAAGWLTSAAAGVVVGLPYIAPRLDPQLNHVVRLVLAVGGTVALLYQIVEKLSYVSIGLPMTLSGYVLMLAGVIAESRKHSGLPSRVTAVTGG